MMEVEALDRPNGDWRSVRVGGTCSGRSSQPFFFSFFLFFGFYFLGFIFWVFIFWVFSRLAATNGKSSKISNWGGQGSGWFGFGVEFN